MESRIYLNDGWKFQENYSEALINADYNDSDLSEVRIPHTCKETPYSNFDESIYQGVYGYRKELKGCKEWEGKHVILTFEGAAHDAKVYVNGTLAVEHHCGYTAFQADIANYLNYEGMNIITVRLDSRENLNVPPFGNVIDYMTYGGIYRDVYLEVKNDSYIEDVYIRTEKVLEPKKHLKLSVLLNQEVNNYQAEITLVNGDGQNRKKLATETVNGKQLEFSYACEEIALWSVDAPNLYYVEIKLQNAAKETIDVSVKRFGFREAVFREDGFYLNGEKLKIRGLNRHQSFPYVGYAMPKAPQVFDAQILKNELQLNAVRTSHYPQSQYFIDRCDEIGLLVFTEFPGWQHIGNEEWKEQACVNLKEMILQYRNHPSIIIWGVRINESVDDDPFYRKTNAMARELDPSRATGGVRCFKKSNLLEDVYTYNDFSHFGKNKGLEPKKAVTPDVKKGYLVSEFNGHMYPTKAFDCEEHRTEHALRYARVLESFYENEDIAGAFGWCMFDYNTHRDFGSGDRICYHGVMDMFRNAKSAAAVYESQSDEKPYLFISSSMDIGEHPACFLKDVYAFTNADSVRLYKNGMLIKEYMSSETEFTHMPHGPIKIDDFIGNRLVDEEKYSVKKAKKVKKLLIDISQHGMSNMPLSTILLAAELMAFYHMKFEDGVRLYNEYVGNWGGKVTVYRFEAVKDGKVVKVVEKQPMQSVKLNVSCDHTMLEEDNSYDVASIRIQAQDEFGNVLPFYQEPVMLETQGDIELIGPKVISLKGGMGGTYVKTTGKTGTGKLILSGAQHPDQMICFTITA